MRKLVLAVAALALAAGALGGCDAGPAADRPSPAGPQQNARPNTGVVSASPSGSPTADGAADAASAGGSNSAGGALVQVLDTGTLGQVLVDAQGRTIYRYDKDRPKPSRSACSATCLKKWTPVQFDGARNVEGIDRGLVGSLLRADGSRQLTINGWPAYTYAGDTSVGEVNGQGVGKLFWAIGPDGRKAKAAGSGTGGY
jgi:predicted lipoprotein with Yx(FWY)xxD motif